MLRSRLVLALAAATAAVALTGCGSEARLAESVNAGEGKTLFNERCASCHALADANAQGRVGPDLDEAFRYVRADADDQNFDESTLRDVILGQILYPVEDPVTDAPGMPANLVTGADAEAVASYVASVAGLPVEGGGEAAGGGETGGGETGGGETGGEASGGAADGKSVFAEAGCGSCHTFADANATGKVGPNLDDTKPSMELAVERVTHGKGAMPPYEGRLSDEQIQAVAEYVSGG